MRIPRVFIDQALSANTVFELPNETVHYLTTVLRMKKGRELVVFNGRGGEYSAFIDNLTKKSCTIQTQDFIDIDRESPLKTHLAIGISRGERFDLVLQKATELGVTEITPLLTERVEVKIKPEKLEKKFSHWQQVCVSACEQSQRTQIPVLHPIKTLEAYLEEETAITRLVLHHRSNITLKNMSKPHAMAFLIGPEGGLSEDEIELAESKDFQALTLGPRVLRTETAPITALSVFQSHWGDF